MSYDTRESSVQDGSPYFLVMFDDGTTQTRYTTEADDITADPDGGGSVTWMAEALTNSSLRLNGQVEKATFNIAFPASNLFARGFLGGPKPAVTTLTIWRAHRGDSPPEFRVVAKGRVTGAKPSDTRITLVIETIFSSLRRTGCRRRYQRACPFILYGIGCGLDRADFEIAGTVTAVVGNVLTVTEAGTAPAGDFTGGIVNYGGVFVWILTHDGTQLTLDSEVPGLADDVAAHTTAAVLLAPGCDLSSTRCDVRFSNLPNYGGYEFSPSINPFVNAIA